MLNRNVLWLTISIMLYGMSGLYYIFVYQYKDETINITAPQHTSASAYAGMSEEQYDDVMSRLTTIVDAKELDCMQRNIYFEARNQSVDGKISVGLVTMNRVDSSRYPDTVCDVVKQSRRVNGYRVCQFSWVCDGEPNNPTLDNIIELNAWRVAGIIAYDVITGNIDDTVGVGDSTHYHADYVNPWWSQADTVTYVTTVDSHVFYRED